MKAKCGLDFLNSDLKTPELFSFRQFSHGVVQGENQVMFSQTTVGSSFLTVNEPDATV